MIGGLTGSTLLTLFVVPVLYTLLKPQRDKVVTADQVVLTSQAPPPADPAATFAAHLPADWGESAFGLDEPAEPNEPKPPESPPRGEGS